MGIWAVTAITRGPPDGGVMPDRRPARFSGKAPIRPPSPPAHAFPTQVEDLYSAAAAGGAKMRFDQIASGGRSHEGGRGPSESLDRGRCSRPGPT